MMDLKKSDNIKDSSNGRNKTVVQIIWGVALVLAGAAVFFRIPQVMPRLEKIEQFSSAMYFDGFVKSLFCSIASPKDFLRVHQFINCKIISNAGINNVTKFYYFQ